MVCKILSYDYKIMAKKYQKKERTKRKINLKDDERQTKFFCLYFLLPSTHKTENEQEENQFLIIYCLSNREFMCLMYGKNGIRV